VHVRDTRQKFAGESHDVRRSLGFVTPQGPDTATGTRASGHPAASDKTE
jgi:hypothetical protein